MRGQPAVYWLERKRVKNINLRVCENGGIHVSAAAYVPAEYVDAFVISKEKWIEEAVRRQRGRREAEEKTYEEGETFRVLGRNRMLRIKKGETEKAVLAEDELYLTVKETTDYRGKKRLAEEYLDQMCKEILTEKVKEYVSRLAPLGVRTPELRFRRMKTRWGSCMPQKGVVTLNLRLLEVPEEAMEYVVLHELCHLLQPDHSRAFYELVARWMPDWKERKKKLSD